jgi:hypothetical protein
LRQQLKRLENRTHRDDCRLTVKSHLIAIVAAMLVVGCGGPPKDSWGYRGAYRIHDAAREGNIEAVKQYLATYRVNFANNRGSTPLHKAAMGGHKEVAELLIAEGADVNAKDNNRRTPLHYATTKEIADLLRKHGGKTKKELKAE